MPTRVAILWHMHQPMYVDPGTNEAILPWVRLHATHAYYDMARVLERHPQVRVTVNFVPCLVEQLEAAGNGTLRERYLEATRRRPEDMSLDERSFIVRQFFMCDRERCIKPLPRFWELLLRRGENAAQIDVEEFSTDDVRDIQVLFNLAWMGFAAREDESDVQALVAKGRKFTEDDKSTLLAAQQRILLKVLPLWKQLYDAGQIELSTTPYFHPILPLLCDSDAARRAMPDTALPPRFVHPEDARRQVTLALAKHQEVFGRRPSGMWPAEGSVSPEALEVLVTEGIKWIATDEGILQRSSPTPTAHAALYQPWACDAGGRSIAIAFRDRSLSDRIGFTYARMSAADAVADFLAQIRRAETEARKVDLSDPLISVVLDGENAWEHYEEQGELFLDAFYEALASAPSLKTVTMSDALAQPTARLTRIHSGSWIESNYRIWIGHPEDNLGWELLGRVRAMLASHERLGELEPARIEAARRLLLSAEGSDWFWWYGDDFETENAAEFDSLFRDRLLRAAALLGEVPPVRLNEPISARARRQRPVRPGSEPPTALIHPSIDGRATSFMRWLGAGSLSIGRGQGAMYRGSSTISAVRYGCDLENLYLRLDPTEPLDGLELTITVANGRTDPRDVAVPLRRGALPISLPGGRGAYDEVLELALPLTGLQLQANDRAQLSLRLTRSGAELERIPGDSPVAFQVPDSDFERRAWIV